MKGRKGAKWKAEVSGPGGPQESCRAARGEGTTSAGCEAPYPGGRDGFRPANVEKDVGGREANRGAGHGLPVPSAGSRQVPTGTKESPRIW